MKFHNYLVILPFLALFCGIVQTRDQSCAKGFAGDEAESFGSGANDIVVVKQSDGSLKSTAINVQVRSICNNII